MSCVADKAANISRAIEGIRKAHAGGAQIVCLQELFTSLYFCDEENYDHFALAEAIPGPSSETLATVAAELGVVIIASLFEKRAQGLYHNTTAVLDADGTYLGKYRKMHIPDDPSYYEKFKVFDTEEGLPDTEVTSLLADAQDRVWGFTFNSKVIYIKNL